MRGRLLAIGVLGALALALGLWLAARPATELGRSSARGSGPGEGDTLSAPVLRGEASASVPAKGEEETPETSPPWLLSSDLPFRLETRDASNGAPVASTWNFGTGVVVAGPFPAGTVVTEAMEAAQAEGVRRSEEIWEAGFRRSGDEVPDAFAEREDFDRFLTIRPAPGHVLDEPATLRGTIAVGVRAVEAVLPVFPEAVLDLTVLGPDGRPAEGAEVVAVEAAGRMLRCWTESLGPGRLRVRGIPHRAGEPVRAAIDWNEVIDGERSLVEMEEASSISESDADFTVTMPERPPRPWEPTVTLSGPRGPRMFGVFHVELDRVVDFEVAPGPPGPTGAVRVRAISWDGEPIWDARVGDEETVRDGEVLLEDVPAGERTFRMTADGRLPARASAVVRAGEEVALVLREPRGARLEVLVTDDEGRPRPSARLEVLGLCVLDVTDGVQRIDPFTDPLGRRAFARVEPGTGRVRASWGSRRGFADVSLRDEETTTVRIVAR